MEKNRNTKWKSHRRSCEYSRIASIAAEKEKGEANNVFWLLRNQNMFLSPRLQWHITILPYSYVYATHRFTKLGCRCPLATKAAVVSRLQLLSVLVSVCTITLFFFFHSSFIRTIFQFRRMLNMHPKLNFFHIHSHEHPILHNSYACASIIIINCQMTMIITIMLTMMWFHTIKLGIGKKNKYNQRRPIGFKKNIIWANLHLFRHKH